MAADLVGWRDIARAMAKALGFPSLSIKSAQRYEERGLVEVRSRAGDGVRWATPEAIEAFRDRFMGEKAKRPPKARP